MSAICSSETRDVVSSEVMPGRRSITARLPLEEKRRFADLAASRQMSESQLALIAIRSLLDSNPVARPVPAQKEAASDRITIRLRPGDRGAIRERASARGMKDSAYLAALVRGHIAANPPLPTAEIRALKAAVSVLAGYGRLLARTARESAARGSPPEGLRQDLNYFRVLVSELEETFHDYTRKALIAWESRVA